jgi:hypothetical protein
MSFLVQKQTKTRKSKSATYFEKKRKEKFERTKRRQKIACRIKKKEIKIRI